MTLCDVCREPVTDAGNTIIIVFCDEEILRRIGLARRHTTSDKLLNRLRQAKEPLTADELSHATGLKRTTVLIYLSNLMREGFVVNVSRRGYGRGRVGLYQLASRPLPQPDDSVPSRRTSAFEKVTDHVRRIGESTAREIAAAEGLDRGTVLKELSKAARLGLIRNTSAPGLEGHYILEGPDDELEIAS